MAYVRKGTLNLSPNSRDVVSKFQQSPSYFPRHITVLGNLVMDCPRFARLEAGVVAPERPDTVTSFRELR
jgi:hypothetical protein